MGEEHFMQAISVLSVSAEKYREEELKDVPEEERQEREFELMVLAQDDFTLFLQMISSEQYLASVLHSLFFLVMPDFSSFEVQGGLDMALMLNFNSREPIILNKDSFYDFRDILVDLFSFEDEDEEDEFNPVGEAAEAIVAKIKAARERRRKMNGEQTAEITTVIGTLATNLSLSTGMSLSTIFEMTFPQLIILETRAAKKEQREMQNLVGSIHGFSDMELIDYKKPL